MMEPPSGQPAPVSMATRSSRIFQTWLDKTVPYLVARWCFTAIFYILYFVRVFILKGWYIITYALAIYHLNLFIAFLSPKVDPSIYADDSEDDEGPKLPTSTNEEFRPFIRRLPEFKFWYNGTRGIAVAFILTFFAVFNVPVFWPILVMYFFVLFGVTMKRQIKHMIKYRYLPFTTGKTKYKGKDDTGKVIINSS